MARNLLTFLVEAYQEVEGGRTETTDAKKEQETVMKFHPVLAPIKAAILPLVKNKPDLVKKAKEIADLLKPHFYIQYDEAGSIGRRYRRADEQGTPFCLTVDFDTLKDKAVTVRDRDTMKQERIKIDKLVNWIMKKLI